MLGQWPLKITKRQSQFPVEKKKYVESSKTFQGLFVYHLEFVVYKISGNLGSEVFCCKYVLYIQFKNDFFIWYVVFLWWIQIYTQIRNAIQIRRIEHLFVSKVFKKIGKNWKCYKKKILTLIYLKKEMILLMFIYNANRKWKEIK